MKIAVLGAGAVGGLVAWHLAQAGHGPLIVARSATAAQLRAKGLTLESAERAGKVPIAATDDPGTLGICDIVFVGLKGQDWPAALPMLRPLIGESTLLVPMLNGIPWWYRQSGAEDGPLEAVDPAGIVSAAIPRQSVIGCVVYVGATRESVTHIRWNGRNRFVLGELSGEISPRLSNLVALLLRSGIGAETTSDIRAEIWLKLLGNATYNPLSVLTGATIGRLAEHPPLRHVVRRIMEELVAVAHATGIAREFDLDERLNVTPAMRNFHTSMLQDFRSGRALELGGIVDAVIELGERSGIATPTLRIISALAHAADAARRA